MKRIPMSAAVFVAASAIAPSLTAQQDLRLQEQKEERIDVTRLTPTSASEGQREALGIASSGLSAGSSRALTPLTMHYLRRYFEDAAEKSEAEMQIAEILDGSAVARETMERALSHFREAPIEALMERYDPILISTFVEGGDVANASALQASLTASSPTLMWDVGGTPAAPSDLVAKNTSTWNEEFPTHEITLSWKRYSNNESGFRIYRMHKGANLIKANPVLHESVGPGVTTYRDKLNPPASAGDLYCYEVRSYRIAKLHLAGEPPPEFESTPSNTACSTYATSTPPKAPDTDGDGIPDFLDDCPAQPGVLTHGCPDKDLDGIANDADFCESEPGHPTSKYIPSNRNGCPQRYQLTWKRMTAMQNSAAQAFSGYTILPDKGLFDNEALNDNGYGGGEEPYLLFNWNNGLTVKGMLEHGSARWCCGENVHVKSGDVHEPDGDHFGDENSASADPAGTQVMPLAEIDTKLGLGLLVTLMERDYEAKIRVDEEANAVEATFKTGGKVAATVASCVGSGGFGCLVSIGGSIKSVVEDILGWSKGATYVTVKDHDDLQGSDFWGITASDAYARTSANGAYPFYFMEMPTDTPWFCLFTPCGAGQGNPRYMRIRPWFCLHREGLTAAEVSNRCATSSATAVIPWPMKAP